MIGVYDVSEADEAATDRLTALENLTAQVRQNETPAIVDMYERAAWAVGASLAETERAIKHGQTIRMDRLRKGEHFTAAHGGHYTATGRQHGGVIYARHAEGGLETCFCANAEITRGWQAKGWLE